MLSTKLGSSPVRSDSEACGMDHLELASRALVERRPVDVTNRAFHGADELRDRLVVFDRLRRRFGGRVLAFEPVALVVGVRRLEHLAEKGRMGGAFLLDGAHLFARCPFLVLLEKVGLDRVCREARQRRGAMHHDGEPAGCRRRAGGRKYSQHREREESSKGVSSRHDHAFQNAKADCARTPCVSRGPVKAAEYSSFTRQLGAGSHATPPMPVVVSATYTRVISVSSLRSPRYGPASVGKPMRSYRTYGLIAPSGP